MNLTQLKELIEGSKLLSAAERLYWTQNIHTMAPPQVERLATVLKEAETLPWNDDISAYAVDLQKQDSPSVA